MRRSFTTEFALYVCFVLLSSACLTAFAAGNGVPPVENKYAENEFLKACSTGDLPTVESYRPQPASAADNSPSAEVQGSNLYAKGILLAAQNGHAGVVKALLSFPHIDANKSDENGISALFYASSSGHLDVVSALLANHTLRKNQAWRQKTPLYIAAENGHIEVVRALANAGAATESQCDEKRPLHIAAENGHDEVVVELLERKCDIDPRCHGETPLHMAIRKGHAKIVQILVDRQCNINSSFNGQPAIHIAVEGNRSDIVNVLANAPGIQLDNPYLQQTPVVRAAGLGFIDVMKPLILASQNIDSKWDESVLLVEATQKGHVEVVKYLLKTLPVTVFARRYAADSLLASAAKHEHAEVVRTFLQSNSLNSEASRNQWQAAWDNATNGGFVDVIMILLEESEGHIAKNQSLIADALLKFATSGNTSAVQALLTFIYKKEYLQLYPEDYPEPLLRACEHGHPDVIHAYINMFPYFDINKKIGARALFPWKNAYQSEKMTPLIVASWYGKHEVVKYFLNQTSCDVSISWMKMSPLYVAVFRKHVATARVILQHHPEMVDNSNDHGKTLLHEAVDNNQPDMIDLLIEHGANPRKRWNNPGWWFSKTPLAMAKAQSREDPWCDAEWWRNHPKETQDRTDYRAVVTSLTTYARQCQKAETLNPGFLPAVFYRLSLGGKK